MTNQTIASAACVLVLGLAAGAQPDPIHVPAERSPAPAAGPRVEVAGLAAAVGFDRAAMGAMQIADVLIPAPDLAPVRAEDARNDGLSGQPLRVGVEVAMPGGALTPDNGGEWSILADGSEAWTVRLDTDGAKMVRVHFSQFLLPEGAVVFVRGVEGETEAYFGSGPIGNGEFWSMESSGDLVEIQYRAPAGTVGGPVIEIGAVIHQYRFALAAPIGENVRPSDDRVTHACHEDARCYYNVGDADLDNYADACVRLSFTSGGSFVCSGTILADVDSNTYAGWLLTANHCISSQAVADTLVTYWDYRTATCNGGNPPSLSSVPRVNGGVIISTASANDHTLMRTKNDPAPGTGYAGWTNAAQAQNGADMTGIHQPNGEYQRLSSGQTTTAAPSNCGSTSRFYYGDWNYTGMTEGGSSGSSIINNNYEVVAQLLGSCQFSSPTCGTRTPPNNWNWMYGRFDYSYNTYSAFSSALNTVQTEDNYEDNDELVDAAPLALGVHDLHLVDYVDYFEVVVDCDTTLEVTMTYDPNDFFNGLFILDSGGGTLGGSFSSSSPKTVTEAVTAGTYIIRITKTSSWGGPYTLDIGTTPECLPPGVCCYACAPAPSAPCPDASGVLGPPCQEIDEVSCIAAGGVFRDGLSCGDAPAPCGCIGDLDGDGATNVFDFGDLASWFGFGTPSCATRAQGDLNCDGVVNVFDFGVLAANFGCN